MKDSFLSGRGSFFASLVVSVVLGVVVGWQVVSFFPHHPERRLASESGDRSSDGRQQLKPAGDSSAPVTSAAEPVSAPSETSVDSVAESLPAATTTPPAVNAAQSPAVTSDAPPLGYADPLPPPVDPVPPEHAAKSAAGKESFADRSPSGDQPAAGAAGTSKPAPTPAESSTDSNAGSLPTATTATPAVKPGQLPAASKDTSRSASVDRTSPDDDANLALGKELFLHQWQPDDKLAAGGDGLGPVFNGRSCAECHAQGGLGGAGTNEHSVHKFEILPSKAGQAVRAGVIHAFATSDQTKEDLAALDEHFRPGKVVAGLGRPGSKQLTSKRDIDATRLVWINSPALWGAGRIDRLTSDQLEQAVNDMVRAEDGAAKSQVKGRFRRDAGGRIGKFGWKAQFATLKGFVADACASELGLSNEDAAQYVPREFHPDSKARHDLDANQLDALVQFVASLPEPRQVQPADWNDRLIVRKGEKLVASIGCSDCHIRDVGDVKNVYSDFRLHKVEDTLKTSHEYYHQNFKLEIEPPSDYPRLDEWKTPPLWGIADTAPYWHDGTVKTLEEAILRHASEAQQAVDSYRHLSREDQESVLAFLNTLRAPAENESPKPHADSHKAK